MSAREANRGGHPIWHYRQPVAISRAASMINKPMPSDINTNSLHGDMVWIVAGNQDFKHWVYLQE